MSDPRPTLPELARFNQHFAERIVPLWQGPLERDMALPYEALDAQHHPLPVQRYRAMACARQLYVFSSRIGQPGAAERAAALFRSLQKHFHDAEHGAGSTASTPKASRWTGARTCIPTPSSCSPARTTGAKCAKAWWSPR